MANRHERRKAATTAIRTLTCNICKAEILTVRAIKTNDQEDLKRRAAAALKRHWETTGCRPPETIAEHMPPDAPGVEIMCAGCGLIVETVAAKMVRADPDGVQQRASAALQSHITETGCTGTRNPALPAPLRRDGRCVDGHVPGCRCEQTQTPPAEIDGGVFRVIGPN